MQEGQERDDGQTALKTDTILTIIQRACPLNTQNRTKTTPEGPRIARENLSGGKR